MYESHLHNSRVKKKVYAVSQFSLRCTLFVLYPVASALLESGEVQDGSDGALRTFAKLSAIYNEGRIVSGTLL